MFLMTKVTLNVWGRDLELGVVYDRYKGEEVLPGQKDALACFIAEDGVLESALESIKQYCLNKNPEEIGGTIDNIFKFVMPKDIYVPRRKDNQRVVALMCAYKFDAEHGLTAVFESEQFREVGTQDIVL
jgi:hypothetical protein